MSAGWDIQQRVEHAVQEFGGLWPREKILLKLTEELGELAQAFRKKTPEEQFKELGDLGFALCALAVRENMNLGEAIDGAIGKHITAQDKKLSGPPLDTDPEGLLLWYCADCYAEFPENECWPSDGNPAPHTCPKCGLTNCFPK